MKTNKILAVKLLIIMLINSIVIPISASRKRIYKPKREKYKYKQRGQQIRMQEKASEKKHLRDLMKKIEVSGDIQGLLEKYRLFPAYKKYTKLQTKLFLANLLHSMTKFTLANSAMKELISTDSKVKEAQNFITDKKEWKQEVREAILGAAMFIFKTLSKTTNFCIKNRMACAFFILMFVIPLVTGKSLADKFNELGFVKLNTRLSTAVRHFANWDLQLKQPIEKFKERIENDLDPGLFTEMEEGYSRNIQISRVLKKVYKELEREAVKLENEAESKRDSYSEYLAKQAKMLRERMEVIRQYQEDYLKKEYGEEYWGYFL